MSETWLSDRVFDGEILPNDFVLCRKDRPSRGGGVLIAVKASIHSSLIPSPSDIEIVSVKIVVCSVYNPPDSGVDQVSSLVSYPTDLII